MFYPRVNSDELKVPPENKKVDGGSECKKKRFPRRSRVLRSPSRRGEGGEGLGLRGGEGSWRGRRSSMEGA